MPRSYSSILLSCCARIGGIKTLSVKQRALLDAVISETKQAAPLWERGEWEALREFSSSIKPFAHVDVLDDSRPGNAVNALTRAWWGFRHGDSNEVVARCAEAMSEMGWEIE